MLTPPRNITTDNPGPEYQLTGPEHALKRPRLAIIPEASGLGLSLPSINSRSVEDLNMSRT